MVEIYSDLYINRNRLIMWLAQHQDQDYMHEHEINHTQRLIDYLDVVKTPHSEAFDMPKLLNDFKQHLPELFDNIIVED
jgi:hypothetical protein